MRTRSRSGAGLTALVAALCVSGPLWAQRVSAAGDTPVGEPGDAAFLGESAAAMDWMMADMNATPSGDVDVDFTAMMIPHHQGAIDMAVAYLRHGQNEQLRRLAQEIIVEQQQEIAVMRLALGQPLPPTAPAPTQPGVAPLDPSAPIPSTHDHSAMHMLMQ